MRSRKKFRIVAKICIQRYKNCAELNGGEIGSAANNNAGDILSSGMLSCVEC
jgi:hypothetical protein